MPNHPLDELRAAVEAAAGDLGNGKRARASLERPKKAGFGDYATNAAMLLAPSLGAPPREIAERLGARLSERLGPALDRVEVAGPGFLNVFLSDAWYIEAAAAIAAAGEDWGRSTPDTPEKVNVEYVSANPTGPLTAASARHAAYGDALSALLRLAGHEVVREYYFNDAGSQVENLGAAVRHRARHEPVPPELYQGEYVAELAQQISDAADGEPAELGRQAAAMLMERIRATLSAYRVEFDVFFSENALHTGEPSPIAVGFERLREHGQLYEAEGAQWLRMTDFGEAKDRVLVRSTGKPTYLAADVAYQEDKFLRGFDRLVYVLGADHHAYVAPLKAIASALGEDPERVEVPLLQFVHIVEGGGRKGMSKRKGDFVTLDELIETIGVDAARWFMISRSHDSTIDLDIDLARRQDSENPVYYVQYAHARIASILRNLEPAELEAAVAAEPESVALNDSERELIRRLLAFPNEVREAVERRAPHRIASYALELGQAFAAFYRDSPVLKEPDAGLRDLRIALCVTSQRTLARSLGVLGVSAPESM